jgi:hypothetical protein
MWGTNVGGNAETAGPRRALLRKLAKNMILASRKPAYKSLDQDLLAEQLAWAFMPFSGTVLHVLDKSSQRLILQQRILGVAPKACQCLNNHLWFSVAFIWPGNDLLWVSL